MYHHPTLTHGLHAELGHRQGHHSGLPLKTTRKCANTRRPTWIWPLPPRWPHHYTLLFHALLPTFPPRSMAYYIPGALIQFIMTIPDDAKAIWHPKTQTPLGKTHRHVWCVPQRARKEHSMADTQLNTGMRTNFHLVLLYAFSLIYASSVAHKTRKLCNSIRIDFL